MRTYTELRSTSDPDLFDAVAPVVRNDDLQPQGFPFVEKPYPGSTHLYRVSTDAFELAPPEPVQVPIPNETLLVSPGTLQTDTGIMLERLLKEIRVDVITS